MPVKIQFETPGSLESRIDALRKTIRNGEGLTLREVCEATRRSSTQVTKVCAKNGWWVKQFSSEKRNYLNLLVNPKTLALCRKQ